MTRHVVLITYGEPPTPAFPAQLRYSWRILLGLTRGIAPIPAVVLPAIALSRARLRWQLWTREHYGSPLESITFSQAQALAVALERLDPRTAWRVHVAWEFRDPLLPAVLDSLPAHEPVHVLPMYVADSAFTHEITRATVRRWQARRGGAGGVAPDVLPPLAAETVAGLCARQIGSELERRAVGGPDWALVLAAHGTLLDPPRAIETGRTATERVGAGVARRLSDRFGMTVSGWLNHRYGGRWTEPAIEDALRQVAARGFRRVVYYPFGFLADNAESELEGRLALRAQGLEAVHLPCLNGDPELAAALARHVLAACAGDREDDRPRAGVPSPATGAVTGSTSARLP
ncbi:MAG TPA: ferrochelatase [Candidatus Eisenbacteria bacterium]|nr:ferrochelatase [Candidatus Eisenbacteria bacterium]